MNDDEIRRLVEQYSPSLLRLACTRLSPADAENAVQALPEAYSAVIHLYYYEGYSIKEIAKLLRLPASTVGTRLARGRERLRRILKEEMS